MKEDERQRKKRRRIGWKQHLAILAGAACVLTGGYFGLQSKIPVRMQVSEAGEIPDIFHNMPDCLLLTGSKVLTNSDETAIKKSGSESSGEAASIGRTSDTGKASTGDVNETVSTAAVSAESSNGEGSTDYQVEYSLFGRIPLKTATVSVVPRKEVYLGGTPIGIYLETDGVFVVETGDIETQDGKECCPAQNIIKTGDYIQAVNGQQVTTKEELIACISASSGRTMSFDVSRDGEKITLELQPVLDSNGVYRAGIWVRNDTQGIGTLTYIEKNSSFGALGHGISDIDTGEILKVCGGDLYDAEVVSIIKSTQGMPGELAGVIRYSDGYKIGVIQENSSNGIYGKVAYLPALTQGKTLYETAYRQEVKVGKAVILSSVSGNCQEYEVEIKEIRLNGKDENKGMILEVTDKNLLELTGGIVQGMSGSPIIQDGKLVGAVTHVLVNDPTRGYGIFIENMLEAAE